MPNSSSIHALLGVAAEGAWAQNAGDMTPGEELGQRALLPLSVQNAYRERYRAIRPGWRSSGDQLEAIVRRHLKPSSHVLDLGCGRGGVVELIWRDLELAVGLSPDAPSLSENRASWIPVIRGAGAGRPVTDQSLD